jgi:hypothetical protein
MKATKTYLSMLCLFTLTGVISSCNDFLEEKPLDAKSSNQFWQTEADAESAVNALYFGGVPYLNNTDLGTGWAPKATMWNGIFSGLFVDKKKDRSFTSACENLDLNVASFDGTAMTFWHEFYKGISRANFVIANIPTMAEVLDEATIKNYVGQAKFFRAYGYFWLVKEFGDVPYVDEPYTSTDGMFKERMPAAQVYQKIESDLLDAIGGLTDKAFYDNGCYVTKSTAQTLLAEVYLQWAGQPVNGGNTYYSKAAEMAKNVIAGGKHALIQATGSSDDQNSAFNVIKTTKKESEIIYAKEYNYASFDIGNSYHNRCMDQTATGWGCFSTSVLYNSYLPCAMLLNSYEAGDIRNHEKQFFFEEYTDANGVSHNLSEKGLWAWFDEEALIGNHGGDYNMPTFRYAEVLLIAAEGLARVGGSDGEARGYLNQVRTRAGLADETTATGDDLVKIILTERLHEFPLEFKVWDDIRRTRLYPEADGANSGTLKWTALSSATIQNKPEGSNKVGAIPEWALLWPLPLTEMQSNPSLTPQNPGWN